MRIEGKYPLDAPPERAYQALHDPAVLSSCIPGCEKLEPRGEDKFEAVLSIGSGPIRGRYSGTVTVLDADPPRAYTMHLDGRGAVGFISGQASFTLVPNDQGSEVQFTGDVQVGGIIARVGQRALTGVSRFMIGQFFDCVREKLQ